VLNGRETLQKTMITMLAVRDGSDRDAPDPQIYFAAAACFLERILARLVHAKDASRAVLMDAWLVQSMLSSR
jgi:hypothetical protein